MSDGSPCCFKSAPENLVSLRMFHSCGFFLFWENKSRYLQGKTDVDQSEKEPDISFPEKQWQLNVFKVAIMVSFPQHGFFFFFNSFNFLEENRRHPPHPLPALNTSTCVGRWGKHTKRNDEQEKSFAGVECPCSPTYRANSDAVKSCPPAEGQLRKGNALPNASFLECGDTFLFQSVLSDRITLITSSKIMSKPNEPTPSRAQIWAKTPITSVLVLTVGASCPTEVCKFSTSVPGPSKCWHTCSCQATCRTASLLCFLTQEYSRL